MLPLTDVMAPFRLLLLVPSLMLPRVSFRPLIYDTFFLLVNGMSFSFDFSISQILKMNINIFQDGSLCEGEAGMAGSGDISR